MESRRKRRIVKIIAIMVPVMVVVFAGLVWAVFELWNWLMPSIFGLQAITYWQALGVLVLSGILFRGFRPNFSRGRWRHGLRERWGRMTPEEREEFVRGLNTRCGRRESPEPEPKA